jgi:predicted amidophosphoribosyltransferase
LLRRGHHPAHELARRLGDAWGIEHAELLEVRPGSPPRQRQAELDRRARLRNARGAFQGRGLTLPRVLLVDDVYTTGATVSAGAAALRRAGARTVEVVTFARTTRV